MDYLLAYRQSRERLTDLAGDLTAEDQQRTVPATPAWTVKDTYAHVVGAAADAVRGRVKGAGTDAWTAAQVEARAGHTLEQMLAEWDVVGPRFEEQVVTAPDALWLFVSGTWLHEQDIRAALGLRGLRDTEGGRVALRLVDPVADRLLDAGLPALQIDAGDHHWMLGSGDPAASLRTDPYELARAVGGRRSHHQITGMDWQGDPSPYAPLLPSYGPTATDLVD